MTKVPLHDFDEANRTEGARNMKNYSSYLAPLTGSPFLRNIDLFVEAKDNPLLKIYYHLERPPLYFLSMVFSSSIIGDNEFSYRLPSFVFGLMAFVVLATATSGAVLPVLTLATSSDWWLSSQSALMDTSLTLFLFVALAFLLGFIQRKRNSLLVLSGVSLGLAILSKGQPAVIFAFPLLFTLFTKKVSFRQASILLASAGAVIAPWAIAVITKFGFDNFIGTFLGFAKNRSTVGDTTQLAPVYWYVRWFIESFRLGFLLFLTLVVTDFVEKRFSYRKILILFYFIFSLALFSLSKNKVWWYVLPLVPVAALYIHESVLGIIKIDKNKLFNLSLIVLLLSLPLFYGSSNTVALSYAVFLVGLSFMVMRLKIKLKNLYVNILFMVAIVFSLFIFYLRFPTIAPTYPEVKTMGEYYQKLPQPKCLYLQSMPYEAMLYYSRAEEVNYLDENTRLIKGCNSYLITPDKIDDTNTFHNEDSLNLYKIDKISP